MKAIITCGLGWGDEGKGATVDFLCRQVENPLVVRYSGAHQCGHVVWTEDGKSHTFSQFGAGTLAGAKSYIDRDVLIEPFALMKEAEHLESLGVKNPLRMIKFHPECSVTTPYHKIVNRAIQKENNIGSCGSGVGMTRLTDLKGVSIKLYDDHCDVVRQLIQIRAILEDYYYSKYKTPLDFSGCGVYKVATDLGNVIDSDIDLDSLCYDYSHLIFEGAQGMALNEYTGFRPEESTWGNVSPRNAVELCDYLDIPYTILGIARTYVTRHGGMLPLEPIKVEPDEGNPHNDFQGHMHYYHWRSDIFEEMYEKSGATCLALNHLDQYNKNEGWFDKFNVAIKGYGKTASDRKMIKDIL